jgi:hypothetical protein
MFGAYGVIATVYLNPGPGVDIKINWTKFLDMDEDEILDLLYEYYTEEIEKAISLFTNEALGPGRGIRRKWNSTLSQDLYWYMHKCKYELAEWLAERTWRQYSQATSRAGD